MRLNLLGLAAVATALAGNQAALGLTTDQTPPQPAITEVDLPTSYVIDNAHTHVIWRVDRFGFTNTVGSFVDVSGNLTLDYSDPVNSRVDATIALAGLRSDHAEREDIVRGNFWLEAESFPTIKFTSHEVQMVDLDNCDLGCAKVTGMLTIKGVTKPVTLDVRLNKLGTDPVTKQQAAGFAASGSFNRSDFGIATALGPIGDEVTFEIDALALAP